MKKKDKIVDICIKNINSYNPYFVLTFCEYLRKDTGAYFLVVKGRMESKIPMILNCYNFVSIDAMQIGDRIDSYIISISEHYIERHFKDED